MDDEIFSSLFGNKSSVVNDVSTGKALIPALMYTLQTYGSMLAKDIKHTIMFVVIGALLSIPFLFLSNWLNDVILKFAGLKQATIFVKGLTDFVSVIPNIVIATFFSIDAWNMRKKILRRFLWSRAEVSVRLSRDDDVYLHEIALDGIYDDNIWVIAYGFNSILSLGLTLVFPHSFLSLIPDPLTKAILSGALSAVPLFGLVSTPYHLSNFFAIYWGYVVAIKSHVTAEDPFNAEAIDELEKLLLKRSKGAFPIKRPEKQIGGQTTMDGF